MRCYKPTAGCGVYLHGLCSKCPYSKPPHDSTIGSEMIRSNILKDLAVCDEEIIKHRKAIVEVEERKKELLSILNNLDQILTNRSLKHETMDI